MAATDIRVKIYLRLGGTIPKDELGWQQVCHDTTVIQGASLQLHDFGETKSQTFYFTVYKEGQSSVIDLDLTKHATQSYSFTGYKVADGTTLSTTRGAYLTYNDIKDYAINDSVMGDKYLAIYADYTITTNNSILIPSIGVSTTTWYTVDGYSFKSSTTHVLTRDYECHPEDAITSVYQPEPGETNQIILKKFTPSGGAAIDELNYLGERVIGGVTTYEYFAIIKAKQVDKDKYRGLYITTYYGWNDDTSVVDENTNSNGIEGYTAAVATTSNDERYEIKVKATSKGNKTLTWLVNDGVALGDQYRIICYVKVLYDTVLEISSEMEVVDGAYQITDNSKYHYITIDSTDPISVSYPDNATDNNGLNDVAYIAKTDSTPAYSYRTYLGIKNANSVNSANIYAVKVNSNNEEKIVYVRLKYTAPATEEPDEPAQQLDPFYLDPTSLNVTVGQTKTLRIKVPDPNNPGGFISWPTGSDYTVTVATGGDSVINIQRDYNNIWLPHIITGKTGGNTSITVTDKNGYSKTAVVIVSRRNPVLYSSTICYINKANETIYVSDDEEVQIEQYSKLTNSSYVRNDKISSNARYIECETLASTGVMKIHVKTKQTATCASVEGDIDVTLKEQIANSDIIKDYEHHIYIMDSEYTVYTADGYKKKTPAADNVLCWLSYYGSNVLPSSDAYEKAYVKSVINANGKYVPGVYHVRREYDNDPTKYTTRKWVIYAPDYISINGTLVRVTYKISAWSKFNEQTADPIVVGLYDDPLTNSVAAFVLTVPVTAHTMILSTKTVKKNAFYITSKNASGKLAVDAIRDVITGSNAMLSLSTWITTQEAALSASTTSDDDSEDGIATLADVLGEPDEDETPEATEEPASEEPQEITESNEEEPVTE